MCVTSSGKLSVDVSFSFSFSDILPDRLASPFGLVATFLGVEGAETSLSASMRVF